MGFFEFNIPKFVSYALSVPANKQSFYADFLNGFFATLLAPASSAILLGTAVSAAFTQSSLIMVFIFFFDIYKKDRILVWYP